MQFHDRSRPFDLHKIMFVVVGMMFSLTSSLWAQSAAVNSNDKQLRQPTPAEIKVLTEGIKPMLNRDATGLVVVKHPNGAESMNLQGRFMNLEIVRANGDGTLSGMCVNNMEDAKRFLNREPKAGAQAKAVKKQAQPVTSLEEK